MTTRAASTTASTMKCWQYATSTGPLESNIQLIAEAPMLPPPHPHKSEMLVHVASMSLNPADYKFAELGFITKAAISLPASPGMDFAGTVVSTGLPTDKFKADMRILGRVAPTQFGTLGEYVIVSYEACAELPKEMSFDQGAAVGTAGLTAYQCIAPHVKSGDKVFINGGSGGTGSFGIQIAKTLGCHVTVSCSTAKIDRCKELGADAVIDYTNTDVTKKLSEEGLVYALVVDNVGSSPADLYTGANAFLRPEGRFVHVGGAADMASAKTMLGRKLLPGFLGGGKRAFEIFVTKDSGENLKQIVEWVIAGKVKVPVEETFAFEDAPKAIELLKKGRTAGKIVVHVSEK